MKSTLFVGLLATGASAQLNRLAKAAGLQYFGTTVDTNHMNDAPYMAVVNDIDEFGQLVPENSQKMAYLQPNQGQWTYTEADRVPDLAARNGQVLRCHTLTWHSQAPDWVTNGQWTYSQLQSVIETHIANVVGHFKGACHHWDVVNEAADDNGGWRDSVFYRVMGTDFLPISFEATKAADPNTKLYYNDYNLEYNGAKTDRVFEAVNIIQAAGAPIDGVGFQGHLIVGSTPSRANLAAALRRFTGLGLEVAYTEVDIRHSSMPPSSQALVQQGNDYANVVGSCLDVEGCIGFTVWGVSDKYSWVPQTFDGEGAALLYDDNLNKKPAWSSVSSILAAAATSAPAPTDDDECPEPTTVVTSSSTKPVETPTTTPEPSPTDDEDECPEPTTAVTTSSDGVTTTTSSEPIVTPTSTPGGADRYGQCAGQGYNGPLGCKSPWTCTYVNDWYSQCL